MEWRSIAGLSRYEISKNGSVRLKVDVMMPPGGISGVQAIRFPKGYILKPIIKKPSNGLGHPRRGYFLRDDNGKGVNILEHRFVALAFVPNPNGLPMVCHRDGDAGNNNAANLYWGTAAENSQDMWKHGTVLKGERAPANKLSTDDVKEIRLRRAEGVSLRDLAGRFGVAVSTISAVATGQNWKWM